MAQTTTNFDSRYPNISNGTRELFEALDDMCELAARGGEESFHYVCGGVFVIKRMGHRFGLEPQGLVSYSPPGMLAAVDTARALYSQELFNIEPVVSADVPQVPDLETADRLRCLCPVLHLTMYSRCPAQTHLTPS